MGRERVRHAPDTGSLAALLERLEARSALVGVIGVGYVGLPAAVAMSEAGFRVLGVDVDQNRVAAIEAGHSFLADVPDERVAAMRRAGRLRATPSYRGLSRADAVLICVPTPLTEHSPDLSAVREAAKSLAEVLTPGTLVVLESTTYPGTTEELLQPILEGGDLRVERDFFLAFSPERIDPGNEHYGFGDIPKVVGGVGPASTSAAEILYRQVTTKVLTVSGPREAEMAKLIENTFRHVNIALVNELAVYAREMGVDIWESIEAAASKPFGFLPFWPGPGWGGHCIPLDPAYLSWRVRRERAHEVRFVELAHAVNTEMQRHVVEWVGMLLNDRGKALRGARVLAIGAAYKGGVEDARESSAVRIMAELAGRGTRVTYHDPLVPEIRIEGRTQRSARMTPERLRAADLVLILTPQVSVDWRLVEREARLVFDCCNALGKRNGKVVRL
jgi:UDP-N-acetyl-D-glucosamine dehydrogenase